MTIHIIIGPPAAGKTTWTDEHAADDDIIIDYDRLAQTLGAAKAHNADEPVRSVAYAARAAAISKTLALAGDAGVDAWIIHTSPTAEQMERYEQAGAEFVLVDPGHDVTMRQAKDDGRDEDTLERIDAWYADPPKLPDASDDDDPSTEDNDDPDKESKEVPRMLTKTISTRIKAQHDAESDTVRFEGYAAVFDNIDLGGDKIVRGAFAGTLAKRYPQDGAGIPVYWNHDVDDPFKNLGLTTRAVEDDHGLKVEGEIDQSTDLGRQVAKLLKAGRVSQMSFAFNVDDCAWVESKSRDDGSVEPGYCELRALDLYEVSICPISCNQLTEVSAKKAILGLDDDTAHEKKNSCPDAGMRLGLAACRLRMIHITEGNKE